MNEKLIKEIDEYIAQLETLLDRIQSALRKDGQNN